MDFEDGNWRVLYDKVLVERLAPEAEKAGLAVPDAHQRPNTLGKVLAHGQGRVEGARILPLTVKVGDVVKFTAYSGVPLDDDNPNLVLLREDEILAFYRDGVG